MSTETNGNYEHDEKKRVLGRITKMLAIANDAAASAEERDTALRMAHATLAKYNLSMAEVESTRKHKSRDAQAADPRSHVKEQFWGYPWARRVAASVAKLFFCEYLLQHHHRRSDVCHHYFIGREANATTAQLMAFYVIGSILKEANARKRDEHRDWAWHTSFCKGAADAVAHRCNELRKDAERGTAQPVTTNNGSIDRHMSLAVVYVNELEANKQYAVATLGAKYSDKTRYSRERAAGVGYGAGKEYGSTINLSKQVK